MPARLRSKWRYLFLGNFSPPLDLVPRYKGYNKNMNTRIHPEKEDALTIGEVSRLAGVNRETLRYYEREGIIDPPSRKDSGYRIYPLDTVKRIRFIKRAQTLGFSLKEIMDMLALRNDAQDATCRDVKQYAQDKVKTIEKKLADLKRMRSRLRDLIAVCDEENSVNACPILDAFEEGSNNED
jgi:Hg(II)-responsive transcriptional regulator